MKTTAASSRYARGFTLLELLVAVAITLLIAGVMLGVVRSALQQWAGLQARQSQAVAAQLVLDLLERDLQAALWRADANRWLAVDLIDAGAGLDNHGWLLSSGPMKPAGVIGLRSLPEDDGAGHPLDHLRFGLSGAWLRFVTTNVESGGGLPTVVSYQLARRPVLGNPTSSNPAPIHYALYRSAVSDSETFARGYDVLASAYGSASNAPSSALSSAYRQPRNVTNPSHANLLASNVVDFGCWLHVRGAGGQLERIFPADPADATHPAVGGSLSDDSRMPEVADVFVRIMGEAGAAALEALESGRLVRPAAFATDADWWWSVVEANSQVYFRRIEIAQSTP
jgi:prepilin-type N-terminal cleavage/methylation domain-containing protein